MNDFIVITDSDGCVGLRVSDVVMFARRDKMVTIRFRTSFDNPHAFHFESLDKATQFVSKLADFLAQEKNT